MVIRGWWVSVGGYMRVWRAISGGDLFVAVSALLSSLLLHNLFNITLN